MILKSLILNEIEANLDNARTGYVDSRIKPFCLSCGFKIFRSYMIFDEELESEIQILQKST